MHVILGIDLGIDPLTGIPNLFGLFESINRGTFISPTLIIAADITQFTMINEKYGRDVGDTCVRAIAGLMKSEAKAQNDNGGHAEVFRIGGDEFMLTVPVITYPETEIIVSNLQWNFKRIMADHGIPEAGLYITTVDYNEKQAAAVTLMKIVYLALENTRNNPVAASTKLPVFAERLIDTMISRIYETIELLKQTHTEAITDEISGLPNHRAAELFLQDMLQKHQTSNEEFGILFIDGDNLKQYNNLGYQRGNQMIKDLAEVISHSVRHCDIIARWLSGDEFIVFLPRAGRYTSLQVGERLRANVQRITADWPFPITVSIGIAVFPTDGTEANELMRCAELANAAAKLAGKNKVM